MSAMDFENLVDYAHRQALLKYDDDRLWFYVTDKNITLGEVAKAVSMGGENLVKKLVEDGSLEVYKTIRDIPGDDFYCIYFTDAYFLKTYYA